MELETITTVPIAPTSHWAFDEMLEVPEQLKPRRTGDPWWAVTIFLLGAFLSVGAGAFIITVQVLR
jgi:hypothetical protein